MTNGIKSKCDLSILQILNILIAKNNKKSVNKTQYTTPPCKRNSINTLCG